jgi:hypothetical protein
MSAGLDTEQAVLVYSAQFYLKFNSNLAEKDHTAYPMTDEMLMKITDFMLCIKDGSTVAKLKNEYPCSYIYINTFDVINMVVGGKPILVYRQMPDESVTLPPVNQCVIISCRSTCFVDIRAVHIASGTHMEGSKLLDAGKEKFGASILRWAYELFTRTCPSCIQGSIRPTHKVGHCPIISLGFGSRGQIDLTLSCNQCQNGLSNGS